MLFVMCRGVELEDLCSSFDAPLGRER